jgi:hypothetical protein
MSEVLSVARRGATFAEPIEAIEAFTTVACTWLIVSPSDIQDAFKSAFASVRVRGP